MRAANILTSIAVLLWFGLFLVGRSLISGVIHQRAPGYPNIGQVEFYIVLPAFVVMTLLACAWAFNGFRRWPWLLALISGGSLLALLPFVVVYGGGV